MLGIAFLSHKISPKKEWLVFAVLFGIIGLGHGYFLRQGHAWGDDFAQYLMHARNLAEGRPYAQTGYIYNPHYPEVGPPAYPPGTAVILAVVWRICGLWWPGMKAVMIFCLIIWLALLNGYFRPWMPLGARAGLVLLIGLNPLFLDQTNTIGSDLPFLVWVYLTLVLVESAPQAAQATEGRKEPPKTSFSKGLPAEPILQQNSSPGGSESNPGPARPSEGFGWYLGAAFSAWAAFATRTIGLVLWPAILIADCWQHRRLQTAVLWGTAVWLVLVGLLCVGIPGIFGYLGQVAVDPSLWIRHLVQYGRQLAAFWKNPFSKPVAAALAAGIAFLALVGYVGQWRQKISAREVFFLLYAGSIVGWPSYQGFRMLNPLVPLWLFYAWLGGSRLGQWYTQIRLPLGRELSRLGGFGLAGIIIASYTLSLLSRPTGPLPEGIGRPCSQELFQAVREHTQPDDVLIFIKPRALALLTGRAAAVYPPAPTDEALWHYVEQIQARYLVVVRRPEAMQGAEDLPRVRFLADFAERNAPRVQLVWANQDFALYRIRK